MRQLYQRIAYSAPVLLISSTCLLCFANLLLRYPGEHCFDSRMQFEEAITHNFTDWHPPIMAVLWMGFRLIGFSSYGSMFVFHTVIYWLGFGLLSYALLRANRAKSAFIALAFGASPTLLMITVNIFKDVGMAACLLAAFSMIYFYRSQAKQLPLVASLFVILLLCYATLVRTNAPLATAPIWIYFLFPWLASNVTASVGLSVLLATLSFPAAEFINTNFIGAIKTHSIRSLVIYDLAGIAFYADDPSVFGGDPELLISQVKDCYTPLHWDLFIQNNLCGHFWDHLAVSRVVVTGEERSRKNQSDTANLFSSSIQSEPNQKLFHLWIAAISDHPTAYLKHKIAHLNSALFFYTPERHGTIWRPQAYYDSTIGGPSKPWRMLVFRSNIIYNPSLMVAVGMALLLLYGFGSGVRALQDADAIISLSISAILYSLAYALIGVATDIRYHLWTLMAVPLAMIISFSSIRTAFNMSAPWKAAMVIAPSIFILIAMSYARLTDTSVMYLFPLPSS